MTNRLKAPGLVVMVALWALLAWIPAAAILAQESRASAPGDSLRRRELIYRKLFAGIRLTPSREARAKAVIASSERQRAALDTLPGREAWSRALAIHARRDSVLLRLLDRPSDRSTFLEHARDMRPLGSP
jgi:hypothetical protein